MDIFYQEHWMNLTRDKNNYARLEQPGGLTSRQAQVFDLVLKGYTNQQIADSLGIRFYTVSTHLKTIYKKMGVHKRAAAVARMLAGHVTVNRNAPQLKLNKKQLG